MKSSLALFTIFVFLFSFNIKQTPSLAIEFHKKIPLLKTKLSHLKNKNEFDGIEENHYNNEINDKDDFDLNIHHLDKITNSKFNRNLKSHKEWPNKDYFDFDANKKLLDRKKNTKYPDPHNKALWTKGNCFVLLNNNFYNLYKLRDKNLSLLTEGGYMIDFNLCKDVVSDNGKRSLVINKAKSIRFSDRFIYDKYWASENNKLYLDLPYGDPCNNDETEQYITTLILKCNPKVHEPIIRNTNTGKDAFNKDNCHNYIKIETKEACSIGEYIFWYKSFGLEEKIVGMVMILVGIVFLFLGEKFSSISSFVLIGLGMSLVFKTVIGMFFDIDLQICLSIGLTMAFITLFYSSLRLVLLSILLGFFTGNILYNFLLQFINLDPFAIYWISLGGCVVFFVIFTLIFSYAIVIITTSIFGAYILVRGVSLHLGGFPEETYTSFLIINGEFNQLNRLIDKTMLLYLLSMGGMFLLGCVSQGFMINDIKTKKRKSLLIED